MGHPSDSGSAVLWHQSAPAAGTDACAKLAKVAAALVAIDAKAVEGACA